MYFYNKSLIPGIIFVIKTWNQACFVFVYQCGYNEDLIFPFYKRITSTGLCNFVGRLVTVAAPVVAELDKPIPAILILCINVIGIIASFFLPSKDDIVAQRKEIQDRLDKKFGKGD